MNQNPPQFQHGFHVQSSPSPLYSMFEEHQEVFIINVLPCLSARDLFMLWYTSKRVRDVVKASIEGVSGSRKACIWSGPELRSRTAGVGSALTIDECPHWSQHGGLCSAVAAVITQHVLARTPAVAVEHLVAAARLNTGHTASILKQAATSGVLSNDMPSPLRTFALECRAQGLTFQMADSVAWLLSRWPSSSSSSLMACMRQLALSLQRGGDHAALWPIPHTTVLELIEASLGPEVLEIVRTATNMQQEATGLGIEETASLGTWGMLGLAILVANSVQGTPQLIAHLLHDTARARRPHPAVSRADVMEFVHALVLLTRHKEAAGTWATSLSALQETLMDCLQYHEAMANHEAHMWLMSAPQLGGLPLAEPTRSLVQQPGCTRLTREQIAVIQGAIPPGLQPGQQCNMLHRVQAFAGTGKTTTLEQLVRAYPHLSFLYTCYNSDVQEHASKKLQAAKVDNVDVRTTHSLAFKLYASNYAGPGDLEHAKRRRGSDGDTGTSSYATSSQVTQGGRHQRRRPLGELKVAWARELLSYEMNIDAKLLTFEVIDTVLNTLARFVTSSDAQIAAPHLPYGDLPALPPEAPPLLDMARRMWSIISHTSTENAPMPYNAFLKIFTLQQRPDSPLKGKFTLHDNPYQYFIKRYDVILIDEAQDLNEVTLQLLLAQGCLVILVGDAYQHIYSFNYSVDTLRKQGPRLMSERGPGSSAGSLQPPRASTQLLPHLSHLKQRYEQSTEFALTSTFRMGPEIAAVANRLLRLAGEKRPILGMGTGCCAVYHYISPVQGQQQDAQEATATPTIAPVGVFTQLPLMSISPRVTHATPLQMECVPLPMGVTHGPEVPEPELEAEVGEQGVEEIQPPQLTPLAKPPINPATGRPHQLLYLARTNASLFYAAAALAQAGETFYLDGADFFRVVGDVFNLWRGHPTGEVAQFESFQALLEAIQQGHGNRWSAAAQVVRANGINTKRMIEEVKRKAKTKAEDKADAAYWLSTVHKIKGLESDYVQLSDDFMSIVDLSRKEPIARRFRDPFRIVYVAATRAKTGLLLNTDLAQYMQQHGSHEGQPRVRLACPVALRAAAVREDQAARIPEAAITPAPACGTSATCASTDPLAARVFKCINTGGPGVTACTQPFFRRPPHARLDVWLGDSGLLCQRCARQTLYGDLWSLSAA